MLFFVLSSPLLSLIFGEYFYRLCFCDFSFSLSEKVYLQQILSVFVSGSLDFPNFFPKSFSWVRIMGFLLSVFRHTLFLDAIASFEKSTVPKTPSSLQVRDHFSLVIFKNFSLFLLSQSFWHTFTCILTSLPYIVFVDLFKVQAGVL